MLLSSFFFIHSNKYIFNFINESVRQQYSYSLKKLFNKKNVCFYFKKLICSEGKLYICLQFIASVLDFKS